MSDVTYVATLDDSQVLKALQNIDKNIDKLAQEANRDFQQIGQSAKASGVQMGAVAGVVTALTTELINLGKAGVTALIDIGKQAVQTAIEVDTLKARLAGIFDGSQEAADQAFTFIQDKSKELGFDLSELAGAFIPKTENLAQFERVAKIATALARSDPEQGAIGARIALIEALSGTFTSLQRRFEIPKDDIEALKSAFDAGGIEGFLGAFEDVLDKSGKSFEDFSDTASTAFAKLQISSEQILGRLGEPILQALEDAANKINDFIGANEDELIVFADTIGRAIAEAIDYLSSVDLSQLDTQQLIAFADYVFKTVEAVKLLVGQLTEFGNTFSTVLAPLATMLSALDELFFVLTNLDQVFILATKSAAGIQAVYEGITASIEPLLDVLETLGTALTAIGEGDFAGAADAIQAATEQANQGLFDMQAGLEAAQGVVSNTEERIKSYQDAIDANKDSQTALRKELEETANAGTDAADAIMEASAAERQAAEDADKLAEAQAKVNEKMAEAAKDFQRKLEDIDTETERKRLDIAIEFAQKREDAARDNLRKIADLREKYADDVSDAQLDQERKEEDIARKFGQERIDQEKERREKRLEVERDYRIQLQDIQRQFLMDAGEAEEKRDAVAFIRALKERNKKVQDAQIDRNREIEELRISNQQKTEELRLQQQRELEEARIANERKIEDLRTNLDRQIEEQNENYGQQLEDLATAEQRKNEELNTWRERELEDARTAYARKLEDLQTALAAELALIEEYAAKMAAAQASAGTSSVASSGGRSSSSGSSSPGARAGFGSNPGTIQTGQRPKTQLGFINSGGQRGLSGGGGNRFSISGRRASGGPVAGGYPYLVGEAGKELFVPNQSGKIIPNNAMQLPNFSQPNVVSNNTFNNQKSASLGGMIDPNSLDTMLASKIENILVRVLDKLG